MPMHVHVCVCVCVVTPALAQSEVTAEQRELLKAVLRAQPHAQITPEIRRELLSGRTRGEAYIPGLGGMEPMAME